MGSLVRRFLLLDAVLLCLVTGLSGCAQRGDEVTFVSEFILLCKRNAATAVLPWLCLVAFAAVVLVQLPVMFDDARYAASQSTTNSIEIPTAYSKDGAFLWCALTAVLGFLLVVVFDWRDRGPVEIWLHRAGVVALSVGLFLSLHLIWLHLKVFESNSKLNGEQLHVSLAKWAGYDVVFVGVLCLFLLTSLLGTNQTVSVSSEYVAFAMLFIQTTWLQLACWEYDEGNDVGEMSGTGLSFPASVAALLFAYGVASAVVVAMAVSLRA